MITRANWLAAGGLPTQGFAAARSNPSEEVAASELDLTDHVGCFWLKAVQREAQVMMIESRTAWEAVISSRP
jgi:hypothetical protein